MKIETVKQREALPTRREPYWQGTGKGRHVGYRRTANGGTWIARAYDPATTKRNYHALTEVSALPGSEQFTAAVRAARDWFAHLDKGGTAETITVAKACELYVSHLRGKKGDSAADDAEGRFRRHIEGDPIAGIELAKLNARHVAAWRERLEAKPAGMPKRGPKCRVKEPQVKRKRSASAVNRDLVAMRAALNLAQHDGYVTTDAAWRVKLEATPNAGQRRDLYLTRDQRRKLIKTLPDDCAAFVRGLCVLPLRPGALAALTIADFDSRLGTLRIGKDKAGKGRAIRLPEQTAELLREQTTDKLPAAPLFARWNGKAWDKDSWKDPIKAAAAKAELPAGTTAYTMRHCGITDLVTAGLDLATVATLSGTSVAMIAKHYAHLQQDHARAALAELVL